MIQIIEHRKNSIDSLKTVSINHGVEIDLRSNIKSSSEIILTHDAFSTGPLFSDWLKQYKALGITGPIIANTKEDQLEETIMAEFKNHQIDNYYFLDTTVPTFVKFYKKGLGHKFFLRLSKYENLDFCLNFKDQVRWLWVDCFDGRFVDQKTINQAKMNFKLCLVSPELQGIDLEKAFQMNEHVTYTSTNFQMICTKHFKFYSNAL
jgi:hypothetical protein